MTPLAAHEAMKPVYEQDGVTLFCANCLTVLPTLADNSIDAIVTDPPAGIEFMGEEWDSPWANGFTLHGFSDGAKRVPAPTQRLSTRNPICQNCHKHTRGAEGCRCEKPVSDEDAQFVHRARLQQREAFIGSMSAIFAECLRVAKPGAHALVWALPRTSHWTATALEDAGWEIRDCVYYFFGSGFPKSLDVSKAIDKAAGAERETIGMSRGVAVADNQGFGGIARGGVGIKQTAVDLPVTAPATPLAVQWSGWGTALKPAVECWWLCRKPLSERNIAANVTKWSTGAINIDGCRIRGQMDGVLGTSNATTKPAFNASPSHAEYRSQKHVDGRWPAHLTFDEEAAAMLDQQSGERKGGTWNRTEGMRPFNNNGANTGHKTSIRDDSVGGTSRFFLVTPSVDDAELVRYNQADDIADGDAAWASTDPNQLTPAESATQPRRDTTDSAFGTQQQSAIDKSSRTSGSGSKPTAPCQSDSDCITSTATSRTTDSPTSNSSTRSRTNGCIAGANSETVPGGSLAPSASNSNPLTLNTGTSAEKDGPSTDDADLATFSESSLRNDSGVTRFLYTSKASRRDRGPGNDHPTTKSIALMRWLCRLITPPGGLILDPFAGSGTTGCAAIAEGFHFIGAEQDAHYAEIATARLAAQPRTLFTEEATS